MGDILTNWAILALLSGGLDSVEALDPIEDFAKVIF